MATPDETKPNFDYYTPMWRSPVIVGFVVGLVVLIVAISLLYELLQQRREANEFDAAIVEMGEGQYPKAVARLDKLITEFPKGTFSERAQVWRGIAEVKQHSEGSVPSWPSALEGLKKLVADNKHLAFYKQQSKEIADLMARTALGLATQAKTSADKETLTQSSAALKLLEDNFDRDHRPESKVEETLAIQEQARREIEKSLIRKDALKKLDNALAAKTPMSIYREHRALYQRYPDLKQQAEFASRRDKAREMERDLVEFKPAKAPERSTPQSVAPAWTLVRREAVPSASKSGQLLVVGVADSIYALDGGNGEVLWRRPVGLETAFRPLVQTGSPTTVLLHRAIDRSLVLVDGATGKELWNVSLGPLQLRPQARPAIHEGVIYLAASESSQPTLGKLATYKLSTGEPLGEYVFPQRVTLGPVVDAARGTLLIAGEESSLYVIKPAEKKCERVIPLEHEPDALRCLPVLADRFLFLVESQGPERSLLRCMVLGEGDGVPKQRQTVPLRGWVWHPPYVHGGRLFVSTTLNNFAVFDLGGEKDEKPLLEIVRSPEALEAKVEQPYPFATSESQFWLVGEKMRLYDIKVKGTQTASVWEIDLVGPPAEPPIFLAGVLCVASRDLRHKAVDLIGLSPADKSQRWKVTLGAPAEAVKPRGSAGVTTILGEEAVVIAPSQLGQDQVIERPLMANPTGLKRALVSGFRPIDNWDDGILLWSPSGQDRLIWYPPTGTRVTVPLAAAPASAPLSFNNGVLIAGSDGLLYIVDPRTGRELAEPFAGPYLDGKPIPLGPLAVLDPRRVLVAAGDTLLKLELESKPYPHFMDRGRSVIKSGAPRWLLGDQNQIIMINNQEIAMLDPGSMAVTKSLPLARKPVRATGFQGGAILVSSDDHLVRVDPAKDSFTIRWDVPLERLPVGAPKIEGESIWLALPDGLVNRRRVGDGASSGSWSAGRSLSQGPWIAGDRILLSGLDGSIISLPISPSSVRSVDRSAARTSASLAHRTSP